MGQNKEDGSMKKNGEAEPLDLHVLIEKEGRISVAEYRNELLNTNV